MFIDVEKFSAFTYDIQKAYAGLGYEQPAYVRLGVGFYEIFHFNFDHMLPDCSYYDEGHSKRKPPWVSNPDVGPQRLVGNLLFGEYEHFGVCDSPEQFLNHPLGQWLSDSIRQFAVSFTKIVKANEPESYGWRWHKWGQYIGEKNPKCEYLADEDETIQEIYVYHICERVEDSSTHSSAQSGE